MLHLLLLSYSLLNCVIKINLFKISEKFFFRSKKFTSSHHFWSRFSLQSFKIFSLSFHKMKKSENFKRISASKRGTSFADSFKNIKKQRGNRGYFLRKFLRFTPAKKSIHNNIESIIFALQFL